MIYGSSTRKRTFGIVKTLIIQLQILAVFETNPLNNPNPNSSHNLMTRR